LVDKQNKNSGSGFQPVDLSGAPPIDRLIGRKPLVFGRKLDAHQFDLRPKISPYQLNL
jgi:hypothetical protein